MERVKQNGKDGDHTAPAYSHVDEKALIDKASRELGFRVFEGVRE